jgi:uncharacterized protein (TIGR02466 family)
MSLIPIFPILISKTTIPCDWGQDQVLENLKLYFDKQKQTGIIDTTLHKDPVFKTIVDYMNKTVAEYWKAIEYTDDFPIGISQMWANIYGYNVECPHNLDVDGPANVTAVFYVNKDSAEMGNLFFANPIELILQTQPLTDERRHVNRYHQLDGRTGDLVCFPSWLQHGILPNLTNNGRISLAANYELKGLEAFKRMMTKK